MFHLEFVNSKVCAKYERGVPFGRLTLKQTEHRDHPVASDVTLQSIETVVVLFCLGFPGKRHAQRLLVS